MNEQSIRKFTYIALLGMTILLPMAVMGYKLLVLNYPLAGLMPGVSYRVDVNMQVDGHGADIKLTTYLPKSDLRQTVTEEENASEQFSLTLKSQADNRIAAWYGENVQGQQNVRYSYSIAGRRVKYVIPENLSIPTEYPNALKVYLQEDPGIQVNDPLIEQTIQKLFPHGVQDIATVLTRIHRYLQDDFANKTFSGFTDALTALKLGEASCNGKGRLFIAITRKLNIPSRLVGGLILKQGSKRTSHQWVEIYVNGHWVPFDTINDHLAEIPANYVSLYYGDLVLFKHTTNVNFQYFFKTNKRLVSTVESQALSDSAFHVMNIYALFKRIGISQNLLKILLMIPLGAFVVVVFRNVIGVETFGTFLPALIAAASRETGLLWGMVGFVLIIVTSFLVRKVLDWLQLLHSPKMAVMLTTVVIVMLAMTVFSVQFGLIDLAHITLFPIAIMAITAERFAIIEQEQGLTKALKLMASSMLVITACYVVMDSLFLQSMILAFPELLLAVIGLNLWLGKWVGMRVSEFIRFRGLLFGTAR